MRISFCCTGTKSKPWIHTLRESLPDAVVDEWRPGAPQADYGVVWGPPQQFFDEQPRIKAVFNIGAGVDALLRLKLPPQAVIVRVDDGGMAVQMAEFVCYVLTRHFRELDVYEAEIARGEWAMRPTKNRREFPVGIMGLGVLGPRVAQAVRSFDFPVSGWSRTRKEIEGVRCFWGADQFDEFLAATRVLVCLLPLTPQTQGIMNRRTLSLLQPGGYVINIARGGHLVDEDLIALLDSGHLAGATLDVFRQEPLPADHPFWKHPKVTITPHTSARTLQYETIEQIVQKLHAFERGEPIAGVVDRLKGY